MTPPRNESWRLRGHERRLLAEYAASNRQSLAEAKRHLLHIGYILALDEELEQGRTSVHPEDCARIVRRAIYHARKSIADGLRTDDSEEAYDDGVLYLPDGLETDLLECAEPSPHVAAAVAWLAPLATAPQEQALIRAFLDRGCSSLAAVDRLYGWSHGHAAVLASRIRRKAGRAA